MDRDFEGGIDQEEALRAYSHEGAQLSRRIWPWLRGRAAEVGTTHPALALSSSTASPLPLLSGQCPPGWALGSLEQLTWLEAQSH